ncbi:hypothetical protein D6C99_02125 [Aureobasidium pullulans]|nr:hypothetical protein D6C99_02125 [Aureobasidium pullulans]
MSNQDRNCLCNSEAPSDQCDILSPPFSTAKPSHYTCNIEYLGNPYSITWTGSQMYPDLSSFPNVPDYKPQKIALSPEISAIWSTSKLVNCGADAVLRCCHKGIYPIVKFAHPGKEFRLRIQHEIEMIREMNAGERSLPISKVDGHALFDEQGIFGYRMEYLIRLEMGELSRRMSEVRDAVARLHRAGFSHGDLGNPTNIMKSKEGDIVLIDFGCAGKIGRSVPGAVPYWVYQGAIVTADTDLQALERLAASNL